MSDFLELCRKGDREARRQLYLKYVDRVYGLSLRITKSPEAAEDATQQVFIKVFDRLSQFRKESEIGTWIYRITANLCYDQMKSAHSKLIPLDAQPAHRIEKHLARNPEQHKPAIEEAVRKALATIDSGWAKTFWLYTMDQLNQKDIAEIMGISVPTVKMRLAKVRKMLRERIDRNAV
ncbi:MAG: sigma-70 family RNA polymerase sigma factor [Chitinivibrionales bacterium]|nr:sigma-70 family RNA polymerase sigma factor [Chitinivibrionales bacterium]MBD3356127.1 sigma-70 family RNA polymerase sigma factor [Chitinivibrionales bacterium]